MSWQALLCGFALLFVHEAAADITGRVVDDLSGEPVAGALVSIRARPDIAPTVSKPDGSYVLPLDQPNELLELGVAVPYDHEATINYRTVAQQVFDGMNNVEVRLLRTPEAENPDYHPPPADQVCISCHSRYYQQWSGSRHAGSAVNEWVLDLYSGTGTPGGKAGYVFRDTHDAGDTGFCATCHAPLADVFSPGKVFLDEVSSPAGVDGVTCLACHQVAHVDEENINALHHLGKAEYRFPADLSATEFFVWATLPDVGDFPMKAHYSPLHAEPLFCASCHQYANPETGAPGQTTYQEWLASPYAQPGPSRRTCQSCHMPNEASAGVVGAGGPVRPASQRHTHGFIGATPQRLSENIDLRTDVFQQGSGLVVRIEVENRCGHHFPTGISIRNAFVLVEARIGDAVLTQIAGPVLPFWLDDDVPGTQPGDYAGLPGKGFAKVLQGRINGTGPVQRPVLFIDAESVMSDTGIPSGATDTSAFRFVLPIGLPEDAQASVDVRLVYRRAWRALAVTKEWNETPGGLPVEIEVHRRQLMLPLTPVADALFANGFEAP